MTATDHRTELAQVPYPRELEHEQRRIFDEPGTANVQSGIDIVQDAEHADLIEDKALAELEGASPQVRQVLETQGRHTSDRLVAEHQWRRDRIDTDDDVRDAVQGWSDRHQATERAQAAREQMHQPRGDDFVGVGQLSDAGYWRWVQHCAAGWGVPPQLLLDDLELDAMRDHGYGIDADDLHYQSPDLDDFADEQVQ